MFLFPVLFPPAESGLEAGEITWRFQREIIKRSFQVLDNALGEPYNNVTILDTRNMDLSSFTREAFDFQLNSVL